MEGLEAVASVLAVIQLSTKVASLCAQYYSAVKNAKSDIEGLQGELGYLKITLEGARQLLESPNGESLRTMQYLRDGLDCCSSRLKELETRLEKALNHRSRRRVLRRFGLSSLEWPFESNEVNGITETLKRFRDALSAALQVDQTEQILDINQKSVLSKLPIAKDASFDSHADEHEARCHPETRVKLRQDIMDWAGDPQGECIFWLNGMEGTGKSTISRTVAQSFAAQGDLGGSFFFKRGEQDRGGAALLFTTLAAQLAAKEPVLAGHIRAAIDADPTIITGKALREQFEKLILKPMEKLKGNTGDAKKMVLVIDALDECERDDDIRVIIHLLSHATTLSSVQLKAFLTSRPELPIRLGFSDIKGKYQDLVLHEIPKPIIEHDIAAFLAFELARIRNDYNARFPTGRQLPPDWPGPQTVHALAQMAVPLFIFAATVCRFIQEPGCNPRRQLDKVLQYQSRAYQSETDKLDATYRPVLDRLLVGSKTPKSSLVDEFRIVVGSIVLLAEPLTIRSLACLLDVPEDIVVHRLELLHSVINVPTSVEAPVRIFHLSFRDFLVDPDKRDTNPFWVDEKASHERIATSCIELLDRHLKEDICDLRMPGAARADVKLAVVHLRLPAEVRWNACLETLEGHSSLVNSVAWSHDASRLASASNDKTVKIWDPATGQCIATLEGHSDWVNSVAWSYDASRLASASNDKAVKIWDPATGQCVATLEGHSDLVNSVAWSHDASRLASASDDEKVKIWDPATDQCVATLALLIY
ncbi:Vegetative incompatibility protein HET-E-1 [Madurella mycetomatis]|uniref:Vegetative incompatibility protein HET-E-1 n=1 Tax=Madurella mycetomatis TaxID=100816 RepID=A0A175VQW0_9PEZI|nr:Vegetative incompatibility protein HET-E-1 [Madurella mycetomatis]